MNRIKGIESADAFVDLLNAVMAGGLTNDYWTTTLPAALETSSARNPELFAYIAAQNRLGAPVLFSHKKISELLDPTLKTVRKPLERHHLCPRAWLESQGIHDLKVINQQANLALLEWPDNLAISDSPPSVYVPKIRDRIDDLSWSEMLESHALWEGWESVPYEAFLVERRRRMAQIIRKGYETLI